MPLFQRDKDDNLSIKKSKKFLNEKELQGLVEKNLESIFNCRFIATEFSTGRLHAGRIDTLAISEENNPVIIEYKVVESSQLVNQSLYYLSWINDHKGDFQMAVDKKYENIEVDWSYIRVICMAPGYKKYDLHAVQMMGANIELWEYNYYEDGMFALDQIFNNSCNNMKQNRGSSANSESQNANDSTIIEYTIDEHVNKIVEPKQEIFYQLQEILTSLSDEIDEVPKKNYIAYKLTQNIACVEIHKNEILLFLKYNPEQISNMPKNFRNVKNIGHFGTGDLEIRIRSVDDIHIAKPYIEEAIRIIGG